MKRSVNGVLEDVPAHEVAEIEAMWAQTAAEFPARLAEQNRGRRDNLLAATDFYALGDVTMSAEVAAYRQALRDITQHANWPNLLDEDWPVKP